MLFNVTYAIPVNKRRAQEIAENYFRYYIRDNAVVDEVIAKHHKKNVSTYVVTFQRGGYVIVSGNDATIPILSYSPDGTYNSENLPPAYEWWMSTYDEQVEVVHLKKASNKKTIGKWDSISNKKFRPRKRAAFDPPLITTHWGQSRNNDPLDSSRCPGYNELVAKDNTDCHCGKNKAGCVAVAMAQVMKYWQHPNTSRIEDQPYDWCNMPPELLSTSLNFVVERTAIAELMRDCGNAADMNYKDDCSSISTPGKTLDALTSTFNYSNSANIKWKTWHSDATWREFLKHELDNERPIIYGGGSIENGGHTFICDAYGDRGDVNFFHFNFGWNGGYDDYFHIGSINPNHEYNFLQNAIFSLEPYDQIVCDESINLGTYYAKADRELGAGWGGTAYYPYPWRITPVAGTIESADITDVAIHRTIPSGVTAEYAAYERIVLNPGFKVELGANFKANIIPCPACN